MQDGDDGEGVGYQTYPLYSMQRHIPLTKLMLRFIKHISNIYAVDLVI